MLQRTSILFLFGILFYAGVFGQQSAAYTDEYGKLQHAMELYKKSEYQGARLILQQLINTTSQDNLKAEATYYDAMAAVHLQEHDAEKRMMNFVQTYPESPKRNSAYSEVANYYFQNGQYRTAGRWFKKVDPNKLSGYEREGYNFNRGYVAFKAGDKDKAKKYFGRVQNTKKYGSQAKYYLGYLAYEGDDYKKAQELFEEVDQEDQTDKNVSYFQSNISFKSGDFENAIAQAKEQLPKSNRRETSELNKIIGESYFNLEQYEQAIPYLEQYEGKRGRWNNTDFYQLGYAYYKQGDYEKAISQFNKIIDGRDGVAQNAYYHLAESYIQLDKKQQALNAFKNASEMNFYEDIKEDAALNYAKLSYEIGNNYKSIPEVLTHFLEDYPQTSARAEIQSLLVDSYITSKNYEKAMELMEYDPTFDQPEVYQKVAFYRGLELYDEQDYAEAKEAFEKSLSEKIDAEFTARATFWKAESAYNLNQYDRAIKNYRAFKKLSAAKSTDEYKNIAYNMGYAYFNQQKYENAAQQFKIFASKSGIDPKEKNDAWVRLGDSYFAQSNYWSAMEEYNKAIEQKGVDNDYAYYQKAISYGFVDRNQRKIEELNAFLNKYPKSLYKDDALYELGNTYVAEDRPTEAIAAYDRILKETPRSNYISRTLMKQGLIYYNTGENEEALTKFKKVAKDFPNTDEANQAVTSARNIYVDIGKVDDYANWVKTLDYVSVSESDVEDASFESAENRLIDQDEEAAIKGFGQYLDKFPNGSKALRAHFQLAQLLYKKNDFEEAEPHYVYVIEKSRSEFTEKSLENLSRIYLEENQYEKALPVLKRLEGEANLQQNITFAQSNLMKAYYDLKNYSETVSYAEKVLNNDKASERARSDAQIFIARSAMKTGDEDKAKAAYAELNKSASGALGAEAQYYDAYFKRKAGNYQASNESVQVLAKDYSGYREYSVKGLMLMGKNFYDLKDAYQATYILQNVIDNFKEYPEIVSEAEEELKRIKAEEAKINASIDE
ncbi:MAG TPA: tetratricopeptide repeat protein [Flavobacteriaceae bacterium]|nr:tetratricopeptide repeat protein [Flavobacteriaceae bacterium]